MMLLAYFNVETSVFYRRKQRLNTGLNPDLQTRIRLTSRELKVNLFPGTNGSLLCSDKK